MDGAGKTTLAQGLRACLEQGGFKSSYVHSRLKPVLSRPAMLVGMALFLGGGQKTRDFKDYASRKKKVFASGWLAQGYLYLMSLDYLLQVMARIWLPLRLGRNLVCDRYIYDTVVFDVAANLPYSRERTMRIIKSYQSLMPRPDLLFVVDVPEEVAYSRKSDIPSLEYLRGVRRLFLEMGELFQAIILDGSRPVAEVCAIAEGKTRELLSIGRHNG